VDERFRAFDDRLNEMRRALEEKIADSKIQTIRWMVGLMFAQTTILIGIVTLIR
jgi:hypothetical protein